MLSTVLDVFRLRQYFNVITRARELADGVKEDQGLLDDARRALVRLPFEHRAVTDLHPFPAFSPMTAQHLRGRRLALVATGGSGAMASIVGVARALEEANASPAMFSVWSGSALFGFPLGAGIPAEKVAEFTLGLQPADYIDPEWRKLLTLPLTAAKGFAGILKGQRIESTYRELLGNMTLGELPIPTYAPIWNVEENRLDYIGPKTHPDMPVYRAVHMAIALPLFISPVPLDGGYWCDGGIVDIFPVYPVLDLEGGCDVAVAVNGFYPPGFAGEDATGWEDRRGSILYVASQVRTCQQEELARVNLTRLREAAEVVMVEPVPYAKVRGVGFYRQFLNNAEWPEFMRSGRLATRAGLSSRGRHLAKTA